MNRIITSIFLSASMVLTLASCNSNEESAMTSNPKTEEAPQAKESVTSQPDFTPEEIQARKERKEQLAAESERLRKENPVLATEYNTTSVYKYIVTANEFSTFAKLLQASDLGKSMHNTNMTVFVPNDQAFAEMDQGIFHQLFKPSKKDALNKFVNNHICLPSVGAVKLDASRTLSDGNGNAINVVSGSTTTVNGAEAILKDINTKTGNIIQVKSPIGFPTSL